MRKAMFLLITSAMIFSFVGCGSKTSATSETSSVTTDKVVAEKVEDKTELAELKATEENEKLNNDSSKDETKIQEPNEVATSRPEANASTNWEDYLDGNTWNLTAYAEALGYEWIPDPECEGLVMYKIVHNGNNFFCCYYCGVLYVFYGGGNGERWYISGMSPSRGDDIIVVSDGQEDTKVITKSAEFVASIFECLARDDADLTKLPIEHYDVCRSEGTAQYYDNGLIVYHDFGHVVESITCGN